MADFIYLDNNSTTPTLPAVWKAMRPFLETEYGNPASAHRVGSKARKALEDARERISHVLANDIVEGSNLDPGRVHAVTGGNPFFVAEVAKNPDHPLPASIRDAILARTVGIAEKDFDVLRLAATAPDRLDDFGPYCLVGLSLLSLATMTLFGLRFTPW